MLYRGKNNKTIFEFLPASSNSWGNLIILDGLPSSFSGRNLMEFFSQAGLNVFYPRYYGTWESSGNFLKKSPALEINSLIKKIQTGKVYELYANKSWPGHKNNTFVLATSFGGGVSLCLSEKLISAQVILSPITNFLDFKTLKTNPLVQLGKFLKTAYNQGYRFSDKDWQKMLDGKIFNPKPRLDQRLVKKTLVLADKKDSTIKYDWTKKYCQLNQLRLITSTDRGHITFSKIKAADLKIFLQFFKENSRSR